MIAILTDFNNSEYLGVMKGVIYSINPNSKIIDLYNFVNPQNIKEAAWILYTSYRHFPKNTIFLCVVDPGVGSSRQCLAIKTKNYFFVGPDNGLMCKAAMEDKILKVVKLSAKNASMIFHGRDVFAKAASMLEKGARIGLLGTKTEMRAKLDFYLKGRKGEIVRIDHFGNIITNLPPLNKTAYITKAKNLNQELRFYKTYDEAPKNKLFVLEGSSGTLEISVKNFDASKKLRLNVGDRIEIS